MAPGINGQVLCNYRLLNSEGPVVLGPKNRTFRTTLAERLQSSHVEWSRARHAAAFNNLS